MLKINKRQISKWILSIYLAITVIFLFTGLAASLKENRLGSAEVASWVQAIGSIAAILLAIFIAWWQGQRDAFYRKRDELNRLRILTLSIQNLASRFDAIVNDLSGSYNFKLGAPANFFHKDDLISIEGAVRQIHLHTLPTLAHVKLIIKFTSRIDELRCIYRLLESADRSVATQRVITTEFNNLFDLSAELVNEAAKIFDKIPRQ